ncbi:MAG TPA: hypothetical protein VH682_24605 [Gemmataceae bacterium]
MTHNEFQQALQQAQRQLTQRKEPAPARKRAFPPGVAKKGGQAAAVANRQLADEAYLHLYALLAELRTQGLSLRAIAAELNARGERTRVWVKPWNAEQVRRVLKRGERLRQARE